MYESKIIIEILKKPKIRAILELMNVKDENVLPLRKRFYIIDKYTQSQEDENKALNNIVEKSETLLKLQKISGYEKDEHRLYEEVVDAILEMTAKKLETQKEEKKETENQ